MSLYHTLGNLTPSLPPRPQPLQSPSPVGTFSYACKGNGICALQQSPPSRKDHSYVTYNTCEKYCPVLIDECKYYSEIKPYNNIYNAYTNGTSDAGYGADVFEKNCRNARQFNTLKENSHNYIFTLK